MCVNTTTYIALVVAFLTSCGATNSLAQVEEITRNDALFTSSPWDEGQALFYSDPYWRGGDCASTVDLGDGRVLWLFADSYVGIMPPYRRDTCCVTMIRNCLGIQHGYDPSVADFTVHWRGTVETPSPFFPNEETSWYWPGNAVKIGNALVVFLMRLCPTEVGFGFEECGDLPHAAYLIEDFSGEPGEWSITDLGLTANRFGIMLGAATLVEPPFIYSFGVPTRGECVTSLARWRCDSLLAGSSDAIEWWVGDSTGWVQELALSTEPAALFSEGMTEFSVVYDSTIGQYVSVQTVGFGSADVMMRTSPALTGPWSELQLIYEPAEKGRPNMMIYAAKTHPEISGADLVITYNTNATLEQIIGDTTIYYPQLIRLNWRDH